MAVVYQRRLEFKNLKTLEILVHSGGGHADAAYQIAKFFPFSLQDTQHACAVQSKKRATLMCLAADNIYLSEFGELGPIDVQVTDHLERGSRPFSPLDESKSLEFLRDYAVESLDYFAALILDRSGMSIKEAIHESIPYVTSMMRPLYEKIEPLKFGEHKRLLSEGEEYARRLLRLAQNPHAQVAAAKMVENYPAHGFVIDLREARDEIGLPARVLPSDDFELIRAIINEAGEEGFYGFAGAGRRNVTKKRTIPQKRIAVVPPQAPPGATAEG